MHDKGQIALRHIAHDLYGLQRQKPLAVPRAQAAQDRFKAFLSKKVSLLKARLCLRIDIAICDDAVDPPEIKERLSARAMKADLVEE